MRHSFVGGHACRCESRFHDDDNGYEDDYDYGSDSDNTGKNNNDDQEDIEVEIIRVGGMYRCTIWGNFNMDGSSCQVVGPL